MKKEILFTIIFFIAISASQLIRVMFLQALSDYEFSFGLSYLSSEKDILLESSFYISFCLMLGIIGEFFKRGWILRTLKICFGVTILALLTAFGACLLIYNLNHFLPIFSILNCVFGQTMILVLIIMLMALIRSRTIKVPKEKDVHLNKKMQFESITKKPNIP
jgi:hypothetical protein